MPDKPTYEELELKVKRLEGRVEQNKQTEQALRISEARFRTTMESLPFDLFVIDSSGCYVMQNTACKERWGNVIGKRPEDVAQDKDALAIWQDNNRRAFSGETVTGEVRFFWNEKESIYHNIISPVYEEGRISGILGINIDITDRKEAEKALKKKEAELSLKATSLEEVNTALRVLLKEREKDKADLEGKVLSNVKELVLPYIEKIRKTSLDTTQKSCIDILESNLEEIVSPFARKLSSRFLGLTPTEIRVADLVKEGKTTKEVADFMNLSPKTIEFHRDNIRKKMGINKSGTNLRTYLLSM